eukprot:5870567-Amphidinium_carterae.1
MPMLTKPNDLNDRDLKLLPTRFSLLLSCCIGIWGCVGSAAPSCCRPHLLSLDITWPFLSTSYYLVTSTLLRHTPHPNHAEWAPHDIGSKRGVFLGSGQMCQF